MHAAPIKAEKEAILEKKRLAEAVKRREELGFFAPFADAWDDVSGGVQYAAHATKDNWDAGVDKVSKVLKLEKISELSTATKSYTEAIANRTQTKLDALLRNPNIIENRLVGEGY